MAQGTPTVNVNEVLEAQRAMKYYRSIADQKTDLTQKYANQFSKSETWDKIPKVCYNIVRPIVKSLSKLYTYPVVRRWEKPESQEAKLFSQYVKGYDRTMKTVDRFTLLTGTVAVRPIWDEELKRFSYGIYTRDMIDITADAVDPSLASQVRLKWNDRGSTIEQIYDAENIVEQVNGTISENLPNPYNKIPLVFFTNEDQPWGVIEGPAQDLVEANLALNWMMTMLDDIGIVQTAGLLVAKGRDVTGGDFRVGHRAMVDLPALPEADAKYINSNSDIDKLIQVINLNLDLFLSSRNIPESAIRATQDQSKSGVALVYEQAAIVDYMNERKVQFQDKDAELAALTCQVLATHLGPASLKPVPPMIKYKEFNMPMSADERDAWQFKIDKNVATPVDMLMTDEPGLDEQTAQDRIAKNKRMNASLGLIGAQSNQLRLTDQAAAGGAPGSEGAPIAGAAGAALKIT
jgi:hypothetical protein